MVASPTSTVRSLGLVERGNPIQRPYS
jgi:hypothetical protein